MPANAVETGSLVGLLPPPDNKHATLAVAFLLSEEGEETKQPRVRTASTARVTPAQGDGGPERSDGRGCRIGVSRAFPPPQTSCPTVYPVGHFSW